MDEAEWLLATDPTSMLEFLRRKASARKLRLFAVACARRVSHQLECNVHRNAIEVAERYADGLSGDVDRVCAIEAVERSEEEWRQKVTDHAALQTQLILRALRAASFTLDEDIPFWATFCLQEASRVMVIEQLIEQNRSFPDEEEFYGLGRHMAKQFGGTLRCIFNPFALSFDPSWQTSTVVSIATGIYHARAWDRLPILSDALADAGCDDDQLLSHLRGPGPHVRGCFALDLVLGKE